MRRDKIVYLCEDTFCLGLQLFEVTCRGKQALNILAVTVTLAAGGELRKQPLTSNNEV